MILDRVYAAEATQAKALLAKYREPDGTLKLSLQRADNLEMEITECLALHTTGSSTAPAQSVPPLPSR